MDRTLVRVDTATLYMRHQRKKGHATLRDVARVAWWMFTYTLGVINAESVAEQALRAFKGKKETWLRENCEELFTEFVFGHIADKGRKAVARHREAGDFVAIVTGATPYVALPLARELGIEHVIATQLEIDEGLFTGRVSPPMSYGAGKVELAQRLGREHGFSLDEATFYSDSITDLPLLEAVQTPIIVNPDARLRRIAQKRNWTIERW